MRLERTRTEIVSKISVFSPSNLIILQSLYNYLLIRIVSHRHYMQFTLPQIPPYPWRLLFYLP